MSFSKIFWSVFCRIPTKYGLILHMSPYSAQMRAKYSPEQLWIRTLFKLTLIYKTVNKSDLTNHMRVSALPWFSNILERTMYNRLYQYLTENKILYSKQFGFQKGHSTEHIMIQLVDQTLESSACNKYTLGFFIDLSKPVLTLYDSILFKKLELCFGTDRNHSWIRKQFIQIVNEENMGLETILCGVSPGSILGTTTIFIVCKWRREYIKFIGFYHVCR